MNLKTLCLGACLTIFTALPASAAIVSGFDSATLARNDDGSTGLIDLGFTANFFGVNFTQLYVNNNGNVTFDSALSTFTPFNLTATNRQIIAPFFADVDTRNSGNPVTYGQGLWDGRNAFGVNWIDVDYYSSSAAHTNKNSFQLILVDRSDIGAGDFDIIFNYDKIQWETGTASGGNADGLGGNSARAGFSNGTGLAGTFFELTGSAINGAFLDGGPNALISNRLNSNLDGRYIFNARNGSIDPTPNPVPAPASLALLAAGLLLLRRQSAR
ncbi:VPLPA-CTERM sorting domain-containing protein [Alishewanella sp. BS5-314]|uniref:nidogen-like domain-containing protein n=1 Tax=Alishewanella sp. BS5-314 TaxID=2755587 RepID=UPI0021BB1027|nr:nidogen-like domain-containing protein [Alishewanella sp. BS5-314]MCT8127267.1 VPLPA-CTERM sorting domain-containing protein [Alishewanella sp. BS5-314]